MHSILSGSGRITHATYDKEECSPTNHQYSARIWPTAGLESEHLISPLEPIISTFVVTIKPTRRQQLPLRVFEVSVYRWGPIRELLLLKPFKLLSKQRIKTPINLWHCSEWQVLTQLRKQDFREIHTDVTSLPVSLLQSTQLKHHLTLRRIKMTAG